MRISSPSTKSPIRNASTESGRQRAALVIRSSSKPGIHLGLKSSRDWFSPYTYVSFGCGAACCWPLGRAGGGPVEYCWCLRVSLDLLQQLALPARRHRGRGRPDRLRPSAGKRQVIRPANRQPWSHGQNEVDQRSYFRGGDPLLPCIPTVPAPQSLANGSPLRCLGKD